ncbi:MAG: hypothetical protein KDK28_07130 [Maritimibacter sp.]|nr:hypothetical protein [Maritimibacter sp.]
MTIEEKQIRSLIDLIEKMVPDKDGLPIRGTGERPLDDLADPLRPSAILILTARDNLRDELGKFVDRAHFLNLASSLENTRTALSQLPEQARFELMFHADILSFSSETGDGLEEFDGQVKNLLDAIKEIQEAREGMDPPHPRTNWRAISVFEACAAIWKDETKKRAPTLSAHTEDTSPFGQFVKAVFELLGIGSSPRVAQDGLDRWRRERGSIT